MKNEKDIAIGQAMDNLNKKYGANTIIKMDEKNSIEIEAIPTGCFSLDYVFACNGIPRGRIMEIFGAEGSGKSTLSLFLAGQVQKQGGRAMLIDVEMAFDRNYAEKIGVKVDELLVSQPSCAEEALDIMDNMISSNGVDLIILDSVASLVVRKELEGQIGDQDIALQARIMSKALRVMTGNISKSKTCVIFVNQLREKIGIFWGVKTASPGGRALKFYSSVRLEVKQGKKIKNSKEEVIGNIMNICAVKNKVGMPWRSCFLDLIYGVGVDTIADIFDVAVKNKIVAKSGNTYVYGEIKLASGRDHAVGYLKDNSEILEKIKQELYAKEEVVITDNKKEEETESK